MRVFLIGCRFKSVLFVLFLYNRKAVVRSPRRPAGLPAAAQLHRCHGFCDFLEWLVLLLREVR